MFVSLKSVGVLAWRRTLLWDKPARLTRFRTNTLVSSASSTITQNKLGTNRNKCDSLESKNMMSLEHDEYIVNINFFLPCQLGFLDGSIVSWSHGVNYRSITFMLLRWRVFFWTWTFTTQSINEQHSKREADYERLFIT